MQGGTNSSEFRIPNSGLADSELEGSLELRVPGSQPSRLTSVPSDKILFPRRMLYVEAVLYVTVAAAAFGLGYLAGRGGSPAVSKEDAENAAVQMRVPVEGKVLLNSRTGMKRGDEGAVVIAVPAEKPPDKPLGITGLRPDDPAAMPGDAVFAALAGMGAAATRANTSGDFTLFVPAAGNYRILIISHQATRGPDGPLERVDLSELGKYFDGPAELLQGRRYHWLTRDISRGAGSINVDFTE